MATIVRSFHYAPSSQDFVSETSVDSVNWLQDTTPPSLPYGDMKVFYAAATNAASTPTWVVVGADTLGDLYSWTSSGSSNTWVQSAKIAHSGSYGSVASLIWDATEFVVSTTNTTGTWIWSVTPAAIASPAGTGENSGLIVWTAGTAANLGIAAVSMAVNTTGPVYCVTTANGTVYTSSDFTTWTSQGVQFGGLACQIMFGGLFVAWNGTSMFHSAAGSSWAACTIAGVSGVKVDHVAYDGSTNYVAVGSMYNAGTAIGVNIPEFLFYFANSTNGTTFTFSEFTTQPTGVGKVFYSATDSMWVVSGIETKIHSATNPPTTSTWVVADDDTYNSAAPFPCVALIGK